MKAQIVETDFSLSTSFFSKLFRREEAQNTEAIVKPDNKNRLSLLN
jgi:hypothetical protein